MAEAPRMPIESGVPEMDKYLHPVLKKTAGELYEEVKTKDVIPACFRRGSHKNNSTFTGFPLPRE